ncbi:protein kinase [Lentinula raphanica]|nr:protein kinase [Lentinula raphanica]
MTPVYQLHELAEDPLSVVGARCNFESSDGHKKPLAVHKLLHDVASDCGHCSIVVEVTCECTVADCKWHAEGQKLILKLSVSEAENRVPEQMLIQDARSVAEENGEDWALNHLPNIHDTVSVFYDEDGDADTCEDDLEKHETVMCATVLEKLHPISDLKDLKELAQVFYDILQIHQWLYERAGILHRDLSIGNLMYRRIDGQVYGVLNDFDLSSYVCDMNDASSSEAGTRSGTTPFMSPDLLNPFWERGHFCRHDLESLFFIMLCVSCRYKQPGVASPEPRAFAKWFSGSDDEALLYKSVFLQNAHRLPVQPYFADFHPWLTAIRKFVFHGYRNRPPVGLTTEEVMELAEQYDEEDHFMFYNPDYDWETLGGYVTYAQFRTVMRSFRNEPLETRWMGDDDH